MRGDPLHFAVAQQLGFDGRVVQQSDLVVLFRVVFAEELFGQVHAQRDGPQQIQFDSVARLEKPRHECAEPRQDFFWEPDVGRVLVVFTAQLEGFLEVRAFAQVGDRFRVVHHLHHLLAPYARVSAVPPAVRRVRGLVFICLRQIKEL